MIWWLCKFFFVLPLTLKWEYQITRHLQLTLAFASAKWQKAKHIKCFAFNNKNILLNQFTWLIEIYYR